MIKILGIVALVLLALFVISFVIYFWNLDDKIKREKML